MGGGGDNGNYRSEAETAEIERMRKLWDAFHLEECEIADDVKKITEFCEALYVEATNRNLPFSLPDRPFTRGWLLGIRVIGKSGITNNGIDCASILITPLGRFREVRFTYQYGHERAYEYFAHKLHFEDYTVEEIRRSFEDDYMLETSDELE